MTLTCTGPNRVSAALPVIDRTAPADAPAEGLAAPASVPLPAPEPDPASVPLPAPEPDPAVLTAADPVAASCGLRESSRTMPATVALLATTALRTGTPGCFW